MFHALHALACTLPFLVISSLCSRNALVLVILASTHIHVLTLSPYVPRPIFHPPTTAVSTRYLYTDVLEFKGDVVLDVLLLGRKYMVGR